MDLHSTQCAAALSPRSAGRGRGLILQRRGGAHASCVHVCEGCTSGCATDRYASPRACAAALCLAATPSVAAAQPFAKSSRCSAPPTTQASGIADVLRIPFRNYTLDLATEVLTDIVERGDASQYIRHEIYGNFEMAITFCEWQACAARQTAAPPRRGQPPHSPKLSA